MQQLLKKNLALCKPVRIKVDFAAVAEEKMAIFIARRGKKLQKKLGKKLIL